MEILCYLCLQLTAEIGQSKQDFILSSAMILNKIKALNYMLFDLKENSTCLISSPYIKNTIKKKV